MTGTERPRGGGGASRERLLDTAEVLLATHGIGSVSLRQIGREAGQRNTGAVRYHFGDLDAVVDAILARHAPAVDTVRHAMLDAIEVDGPADLRSFADALVRPLGMQLGDESGRSYLGIVAQLVNQPSEEGIARVTAGDGSSFGRWAVAVEPQLPEGALRLHARFNALQFAVIELARRARRRSSDRARQLAVSRVVDIVAAILATPLSDGTRRLLDDGVTAGREPLAASGRARRRSTG